MGSSSLTIKSLDFDPAEYRSSLGQYSGFSIQIGPYTERILCEDFETAHAGLERLQRDMTNSG
jgi:hypothetical protein